MNLEEQMLQVGILCVRASQLDDEVTAARAFLQERFRIIRRTGTSQFRPCLPNGAEIGRISIEKPETVVKWDEPVLLAVVAASEVPGGTEEYIEPAALRDRRVLKLLREHFPEFTGRRVTAERRKELLEQVTATRGLLLNMATGADDKVAEVETLPATGKFSFTPGKPGTMAILAALRAGEVTPDGRIVEQPAPESLHGHVDTEDPKSNIVPVNETILPEGATE